MGFIAALISKTGVDVSTRVLWMLRAASPTRGDGYASATPDSVRFLSSLPDSPTFHSDLVLGHKLVKFMPNDPPKPVSQNGYTILFEGRLWGRSEPSDLSAADLVGEDPARGVRRLIEGEDGSYAVAIAEQGRVLCGRDPVGVVPLYIGESETLVGAASNRKMLWSVGIRAEPLSPGCMAELTARGLRLHRVRSLRQPLVHAMRMDEAVAALWALLSEAVEARCRGVFSVSLGFSGGVDSSLLAYYLRRCGADVDLVCVGVEGSSEFKAAEDAAESLGLPIRLESFTPREVEEDLDDVLCSVEEPDPMKVSVALPMRWAARSAARYGSRIFHSGNGSDELFGGYHKYVREYATAGDAVRDMMFRDIIAAHIVNYERDYKVCVDVGVELRLPFADIKLIEFGLALPLMLRLPTDEGSSRKPLLRALAKKIGLPDAVASRRKWAIQYSTGVSRTLRKLAKREGKTLHRFLAERFGRVKERCLERRAHP